MKSIMISIQPKWCAKIESGAKTIEIRKTRPKIETPFKCYIYCTKGKDKGGRMKVAKKNKDSVYRIDLLASTLDAIRKMDLLNGENLVNSIINGTFTF